MKGFVIAGTGSGSGKTTASLAIMAYLASRGYKVAPFKVGPDFIDPGHHTALTGKTSRNLDSWMLSREYNQKVFATGAEGADIAVVEGVMGLFDGYSGVCEAGSTAQMAKWLNLPVVLVVDARSMARSAAAIVQGFENFDPDLNFAGVIFNKTGSSAHYQYLKEAVLAACKMKPLGFLPRNEKIALPERHLGLITANEHILSSDTLAELVSMIDKNTSVMELVKNLSDIDFSPGVRTDACSNLDSASLTQISDSGLQASDAGSQVSDAGFHALDSRLASASSPPTRIAIAKDKAFCFYYQENIEFLEKSGAEIVFFSPLSDAHLPENIHGIYLGGGYPELFAKQLSANFTLLKEIKQKSDAGMPVYGECGGFMYLCSDIAGMDGDKKFSMAGCFPFSITMSKKLRSLGYREITLAKDTLVGRKGDILRGHEFHYSSLKDSGLWEKNIEEVYKVTRRDGHKIPVKGYQTGNTLGSYLHIHFGSMDQAGKNFVNLSFQFKKNVNYEL
ncbi:MAG: cobyrinate a,c-diamide synthase [Thermodesulfobacteriota bacterium]|nr:cobyrinate a,c-diamide synthase [Thermodesulfobacteriota bacterium]